MRGGGGRMATTLITVLKTSRFVKLEVSEHQEHKTRGKVCTKHGFGRFQRGRSEGFRHHLLQWPACLKSSHREHSAKKYMRNAACCEFLSSWQQSIIAGHAQTCPSTLATYFATLAKVREKYLQNFVLLSNVNRNVAKAKQASQRTYKRNDEERSRLLMVFTVYK